MEIICKKIKFNNPIVFVGLPGIGLVGKIAIDTFVKKVGAKKIGTIKGDFFPPLVFVNDFGEIQETCDEIYYLKRPKRDFVFICGGFQPRLDSAESFHQHHIFAKELAQYLKKINTKEVYSFAGINIGDARITKDPKLYFAQNKYSKFNKLKTGLKPTRNTTISGIAGLILSECENHKIPATCILGETSAKIYGDFESAKAILLFTQKHFKINFDMKEIEEEARKISQAFKQVIRELRKINESAQIQEQIKPTYIR